MIDNAIGDASDDGATRAVPQLTTTVSADDLRTFSIIVADLGDAEVMDEAWR